MERAKRMDLQRKIDAILASSVLVASLKQECYWELEGVADLLVLVCSPEKNNVIDKFPAVCGEILPDFFQYRTKSSSCIPGCTCCWPVFSG